MRNTKIICTLGPAVNDDEMLIRLIRNGLDCARFNFSHGTHPDHKMRMDQVKRIRKQLNVPVAIMLDTKGPEIRIRQFTDGFVMLERGQQFTLDSGDETNGDVTRVAVSYPKLCEKLKSGDRILIDDGKIDLRVDSIEGKSLHCTVMVGGKLSNRKSINLPNIDTEMPYMSDADKQDILFGIEQDVDFIAASFVRCADDIRQLRVFLEENGGKGIQIISKIENIQGINNVDEIMQVSDGLMVARGDLGVELPFYDIPPLQKKIIEKCIAKGKLVVTATQMLESMIKSPRPTRAEVSDVANAVYDGTTAIMLSGESASGDYPAEAVKTMALIAEHAEKSIDYKKQFVKEPIMLNKTVPDTCSLAACSAANYIDAKAIIVVTRSGRTSAYLSDFRPDCPIIAITANERAMRQQNLRWGVYPMKAETQPSVEALFVYAKERALESGLVAIGDTVVVVIGSSVSASGITDTIRICKL